MGTSKAVAFPVGLGGKGSEGVTNFIKVTKYSIGYLEFTYAIQNQLNFAQLKRKSHRVLESQRFTLT